MALTVCVDALVYWNGAHLPNRNEASINQSAEVAEAKPFVASISVAYSSKTPTWKTWTVTYNGYYDDTDDTLQNAIKQGTVGQVVIYPTRTNLTNYWYGQAFSSKVNQTINATDYSEMNADFEGSGILTWINA
jgi:hypothetical protein